MALISKLLKSGYTFGSSIIGSKATRKAATNNVRTLSSPVIKTTSKLFGSTAPAIAGGKSVRKEAANAAQGIVENVKVGNFQIPKNAGKVAFYGATGFAGIKLADYALDVKAKTDEIRQYDLMIELAKKERDLIENSTAGSGDQDKDGNSQYAGSEGLSGFLPLFAGMGQNEQARAAQAEGGASMIWGAVALAVIGVGGYLGYKQLKKRK